MLALLTLESYAYAVTFLAAAVLLAIAHRFRLASDLVCGPRRRHLKRARFGLAPATRHPHPYTGCPCPVASSQP